MIESARGAAPFDQPQTQTQRGLAWERKYSEWDAGWEAGKAELQNTTDDR